MGAKVSASGITSHKFGATDPGDQTTSNAEAAALIDSSKGVRVSAPSNRSVPQAGSKAKGATRTKGGSI